MTSLRGAILKRLLPSIVNQVDEDTIAVLTLPVRLGWICIVYSLFVSDLGLYTSQRISDTYSFGLKGNEL
ncbi:hypothetical protein GJ496_007223 [Pomphorhynchus laevis]|nr:hypothetical protein GJ496_007223 [Pomphorhynchus laevis]